MLQRLDLTCKNVTLRGQVIAGHSERRIGFGGAGETSDLVAEKAKVLPI